MLNRLSILILSLALLLGCHRSDPKAQAVRIPFQATEQNGALALQFTNWTVVFEGLSVPRGFAEANGILDIGETSAALDPEPRLARIPLKQFRRGGVTIISLADYTFKVAEQGRRLTFSHASYVAARTNKTIVFGKDGKTREQ
ncbi:MAG TPA: hypothetical protein VLT36_20075 [Candidatus Dormibacteraeota bacterium]|nr:hypothetical protein [Candidatus Dormibacteraeota bacterium]